MDSVASNVLAPAAIVSALALAIMGLVAYIRSLHKANQQWFEKQLDTQTEQVKTERALRERDRDIREQDGRARERESQALVESLKTLTEETKRGFEEVLTSTHQNTLSIQALADRLREGKRREK